MMQTKLEADFPAGPEAAAAARQSLDGLGGVVEEDLLSDLKLLVSELVTNSLRHAGIEASEWIRLTVRMSSERVWVQVCDAGIGFVPRPAMQSIFHSSGWGLFFVGRLTSRWGVSRGDETCVWFEIDRADRFRAQTEKRTWRTSPSRIT
jgi:anti-sigma regulatory factor (Ser/Thr protein kinase)